MDFPTSKADVMARIDRTWTAFRDAAFNVDDALIAVPGPEGWSVKDHVAHVSAWERSLIGLLTKRSRAATMGIDQDLYDQHDTDAINAALHAQTKDLPAAEVKRRAEATHAELLAVLAGLTWEDLNKPYSTYQPDRPAGSEGDGPVGAWVMGNSFDHYPEHQGYVERIVAAIS